MRLNRRRRAGGGLVMTPLIDMVFLALIFFMVNAALSINPAIRVDLPRARSTVGVLGGEVEVSVRADGSIAVAGRQVPLASLGVELRREFARAGVSGILLLADRTLAYERLVEVMDEARIAGAARISLATRRTAGP